ncbi:MAG: DEAD/DEAH box helicase [Chlamydiota bacterium]
MQALFSESDLREGQALIDQGRTLQLLFSEGTYQIEVVDSQDKESFWPFVQIDDKGVILDRFCTCAKAEKEGICEHLAAAYLKIFNKNYEPLHARFRDSLWNQLCQIASIRHGYDTSVLKEEKPHGYCAFSVTGKKLFQVKSLSDAGAMRLQEILVNRVRETEETSLKFSKLSAQELSLWREGRPSHHLCYELSFWSDLAKWLMLLQEAGSAYEIEFVYKEDSLPKGIEIRFSDVILGFYIAFVNWKEIIPALISVNSPLIVEEFADQKIEQITYDPFSKMFVLKFLPKTGNEKETKNSLEGISVGEWLYVQGKGFYAKRIDPYLKEEKIPEERISLVLERHPKVIQKHLVGTKISRDTITPRYHLCIDEMKNLHISCYLFEPGDLQKSTSALFGNWAYVDNFGFYHLENLLFESVEKVIVKEKVGDFVSRHRHWLQSYEGFQTHVSSVESQLNYHLTKEGILRLETRSDFFEEGEEICDFGEWLYIKDRGFYAKVTGGTGMTLQAGMSVFPNDISRFIHFYQDELERIPQFFAGGSPLERTGLHVSLTSENQIKVAPINFFKTPYQISRVRFFGDFTYVDGEGFFEIPHELRLPDAYMHEKVIDEASEPYFVSYELDLLRSHLLSLDSRLTKPKMLYLRIGKLRRSSKATTGDWLAELEYVSEIGTVPAVDVWKAVADHKGYLFSDAGLLLLKPARFNWLKGIAKRKWLKLGKQLRLTTLEWLRLNIFEKTLSPEDDPESCRFIEEMNKFESSIPLDLTGLKSSLRPYQETGVRWLWFLFTHGLSGLLCDEMGLGKTHQAMAVLAAAANLEKKKYLVVCPTSVIYHWEDLLKRFLPHLKVRVFYGIQRTLEEFEGQADILLTSYGTLRSEKKMVSKIDFDIAVFDEIQIAKNVRSQTHRALRMVAAKMRLGLTGTPIENRLLEIKALFDLVLPTYMPGDAAFKEFFVNPIEKGQDPEKKALLSQLIRPFVLRRKKAEVLLELPEKTEEIAYCDLSPEQFEMYGKVFIKEKDKLLKELQDENKPAPYVHVFSLLSNLKQICDHPCLINKRVENYAQHASGKWNLFIELLQETRESGQKLVVFSQYLLMLDIIKTYLKERKIGFAEIRGSTRNRKEELDRFREDPLCEVFVASLQAAGVGIDLVSASVVIHYDRWWNPARENQATDRVHRMGQNRGVQVFKMVTKNTIEEHIHRLIESKMALMEGVIGFDDQDQIKGLDRSELVRLLQEIHGDIRNQTLGPQ